MATVYLAEDLKHELPLFDSGVEALKLPREPPNQVARKLGVLGRLGRIHAHWTVVASTDLFGEHRRFSKEGDPPFAISPRRALTPAIHRDPRRARRKAPGNLWH